MLVPKIISWYRSAKNPRRPQQQPIPLATRPLLAIVLLASAAALFTLTLLPALSPENVFTTTRSNPTTSANLLFSRLSQLRQPTGRDAVLHDKFENKASKLLYYKYGPAVLADCPFCNSQDPRTYLLYASPAAALPHLLNLVLVALATSQSVTGQAGARRWRPLATYAAALLACVDAYALATWDPIAGNEKARVLAEVFFFHWTARAARHGALAALDVLLAVVLYLSATRRMFVVAPTVSERVDAARDALGVVNMQIRSANVLKNTVARDAELRQVDAHYWAQEGIVMQEAMESEEVAESMRNAVENGRINMEGMNQAAEAFAQQVMGGSVGGVG